MTAVPRVPETFHLVELDSVDSTNEETRRQAVRGAPSGTLVWAHRQTAGRGRGGRLWVSPPGNLYCSLLVRPGCPADEALQIGFVAGVSVVDALRELLGGDAGITCKWPNDVLVNGRKVAGILLESASGPGRSLAWLAVGVGVNVRCHPDPSLVSYPVTSIAAEGRPDLQFSRVLEVYRRTLHSWLNAWSEAGFGPVRRAWLDRAHGLGRSITVRLPDETLEGVFADVDQSGALVLRCGDRPRVIRTGDVFPAAQGIG